MKTNNRLILLGLIGMAILLFPCAQSAFGLSDAFKNNIYNPGILKATDSKVKVKIGQKAPGFTPVSYTHLTLPTILLV